MAFTRLPERTACHVGADRKMPDPIPGHDAWVCGKCEHEIASA